MNARTISKSEYKGVRQRINLSNSKPFWEAHGKTCGMSWTKICDTERDAAIAYDLMRIRHGKRPVNVLKPKQSES